jgi:hypothetical protein
MAAVDWAFPGEFRAMTRELGVDVDKPAELSLAFTSRVAGSTWWGEFWKGQMRGRQLALDPGPGHRSSWCQAFEFGFTSRLALVRDPFLRHSVVQLELMTRVPWVISEAETPRGEMV